MFEFPVVEIFVQQVISENLKKGYLRTGPLSISFSKAADRGSDLVKFYFLPLR
jgi:hypothetical protein